MERQPTEQLHVLGAVYGDKGDLDAAASHLTESLNMKRAVHGQGAHREVAVTLHKLGVVCKEKGDRDAAVRHLTESLSMKKARCADWQLAEKGLSRP